MKPVILFIAYSRSGGTLLGRCLQALGDVFVASEVHPQFVVHQDLMTQVKFQKGLDLNEKTYLSQVVELQNLLSKQNERLILRDWCFIDFTPHQINNFKLSQQLTQFDLLKKEVELIPFVLVRNAIDVWISRQCPPQFFKYYLPYIEAIKKANLPIFKYEDFCANPLVEMQRICEFLDIAFDASFINKYQAIELLGDMGRPHSSRGLAAHKIIPLKRKRIAPTLIKQLTEIEEVKIANDLLGYSSDYFEATLEEQPTYWQLEWKHRFRKVLGKYPRDAF